MERMTYIRISHYYLNNYMTTHVALYAFLNSKMSLADICVLVSFNLLAISSMTVLTLDKSFVERNIRPMLNRSDLLAYFKILNPKTNLSEIKSKEKA